jgi:hypothetical protein
MQNNERIPMSTTNALTKTALPFEQQPKESAKAFAAFSLYLSLGPVRSLAMVGGKLGKSETLIQRWSAKYDWSGRVQAYAAHLANVEREAAEALVRLKGADAARRKIQQTEDEWEWRTKLVAAAKKVLLKFEDGSRGATLGDVARALDLASKLGRLSCGMATEKTEVSGEEGGPIRVEVTMALEKIYGMPLPGEVIEVDTAPKESQSLLTSAATKEGR